MFNDDDRLSGSIGIRLKPSRQNFPGPDRYPETHANNRHCTKCRLGAQSQECVAVLVLTLIIQVRLWVLFDMVLSVDPHRLADRCRTVDVGVGT